VPLRSPSGGDIVSGVESLNRDISPFLFSSVSSILVSVDHRLIAGKYLIKKQFKTIQLRFEAKGIKKFFKFLKTINKVDIAKKMPVKVWLPLTEKTIAGLKAGDNLLLSGVLYVARDAAHRRMIASLDKGEPLPFDIKGQIIYYMGPSPAPPGKVIGATGPTTSARMDAYTPRLLAAGLKGMIGKGVRSREVKEALKKYKAVYLAAVGGAGAFISKTIIKSAVVAYPDLGPEAVLRIEVKDFPATVINDIYGGDLYVEGKKKYKTV
jgi:fumarate hydratase subunit beta